MVVAAVGFLLSHRVAAVLNARGLVESVRVDFLGSSGNGNCGRHGCFDKKKEKLADVG